MWRLTPIEDLPATRELPGLGSQFRPAANGVPNFLRLLARSPAALDAYVLSKKALERGQLAPSQREMIALAVAAINGSNYCLAAHELAGQRAGLTGTEICQAQKASAKEPKTQALLHFVQALVLQRGEVSDPDFAAIRSAGFSEGEIIEVLANVVLNIFTNYFNLLAKTEVDYPLSRTEPKSCLTQHLT